jgi:molecular chaperone DnaK (HSP70)
MSVIGIDFGTTNSVAAAYGPGDVEILELDDPPSEWAPYGFGRVIPSVFASDEHGRIAFGWEAKVGTEVSGNRFDAIKRLFASQEDAAYGDDGASIAVEEAATLLFAEIQRRAESRAGVSARQAVVTVPANSKGRARHRTKICAGMGGFEVLGLINEPTAAAMAYARSHPDARRYLIFDWGGGTLDVTVLEAVDGIFLEQASSGIARSGGLDFDARLSKAILESTGASGTEWTTAQKRAFRLEVELAKIRLSTQESATIQMPNGSNAQVTRRRFEEIVQPLIQESADPIERCLRELKIGRGSIDALVLVGGTSKIPAVRSFVQDLVGTDVDPDIDPMTAIAEGAAIAAAIMSGDNTENDFFVSTEHALGTFAVDPTTISLEFSQIIPKSHKLPARATQSYVPVSGEQDAVNIEVVEGDPEKGDFVILKEWTVPIPDGDGTRAFELTYEYDVSGILNVRAVDTETGSVLLDDGVAYGIAEDKAEIARMAMRARETVNTGQMSAAPTATTGTLDPASEELIQKATQKVIPYLDTQNAALLQSSVDALRGALPEDETRLREELRTALQPYSFLM